MKCDRQSWKVPLHITSLNSWSVAYIFGGQLHLLPIDLKGEFDRLNTDNTLYVLVVLLSNLS